jgi:hypothetical protein
MSDKSLAVAIGVIAGVLICLVAGLISVALGAPAKESEPAPTPAAGVIEAAIAEDYVNRAFMQSMAGDAGAWEVEDGRVDIQPGGRVEFDARIGSPVGSLLVKGAVSITVDEGDLSIRVAEINLGQLPLTGLLKPFLPALETQVNDEANRQLRERAEKAKVRLVSVTSDEDYLRFHMAGQTNAGARQPAPAGGVALPTLDTSKLPAVPTLPLPGTVWPLPTLALPGPGTPIIPKLTVTIP